MPENGSNRVKKLAAEKANEIYLSEITLPEMTASIAAKERAPQGISDSLRDRLWSAFLQDCLQEYHLQAATRPVINLAVEITQRRRVRGCDAVQLATALTLNTILREAELSPLVFVASDKDLIQAAQEEGLETENPEAK
jgi:predicted nucleic acid-binding protein